MPSRLSRHVSPTPIEDLTLTAPEALQQTDVQPQLRPQATLKGDVSMDSEVDFPLMQHEDVESGGTSSAVPEPMEEGSVTIVDKPAKEDVASVPAGSLQSSAAASVTKPTQQATSSSSTGERARRRKGRVDSDKERRDRMTLARTTSSGADKKRQKPSQRRLSQSLKPRSQHNTKSRLPASHPRRRRQGERRGKRQSSDEACVQWVESSTAPAALTSMMAGTSTSQQTTPQQPPTRGTAKVSLNLWPLEIVAVILKLLFPNGISCLITSITQGCI